MKLCSTPDCPNYTENDRVDHCASCAAAKRKEERQASKPAKPQKPLKRTAVKRVSPTAKHYGSDGTAYTMQEIADNRRRTYEQMDFASKSPYCSAHGPQCSERMLDHDHTIAQATCKQLGKTELIWDENNIEYSCRIAHKQWESYKDGEFTKHKNFDKRMAFVKLHDPENFEKRAQVWAVITKPTETI